MMTESPICITAGRSGWSSPFASNACLKNSTRPATSYAFNEQLVNAGILLAAEGLRPSKQGKRIRFSGSHRAVIDGPFAETKELIAGLVMASEVHGGGRRVGEAVSKPDAGH